MKKLLIKGLLAGLFLTNVSAASASQFARFNTADSLFAQRDGSVSKTIAAKTAYQSALRQQMPLEEKVYGYEQLARLASYHGSLLVNTPGSETTRKQIYVGCLTDIVPNISPLALGGEMRPEFYYWYAACLGLSAEVVSSPRERKDGIEMLNQLLDEGLQIAPSYEGGGLFRVEASVRSNELVKRLPGQVYNPQRALELIDQAIASEYPNQPKGRFFCENYYRKAKVLEALGDEDVFYSFVDDAILTFEGLLSNGSEKLGSLVPETKLCLDKLNNL